MKSEAYHHPPPGTTHRSVEVELQKGRVRKGMGELLWEMERKDLGPWFSPCYPRGMATGLGIWQLVMGHHYPMASPEHPYPKVTPGITWALLSHGGSRHHLSTLIPWWLQASPEHRYPKMTPGITWAPLSQSGSRHHLSIVIPFAECC